jgi:MFS family permease
VAALQAVLGAATGFFNPASTGLVPMVASAGRLQEANALRGVAMAGGQVGGPAIGGVLVAAVGAGEALRSTRRHTRPAHCCSPACT